MTEVSADTVVDGRYRIVSRIGSGGMADVYSAEDTHLGRQIALKVLHRRFAQDVEFVERFRREAKSAASLSHPNVVGIFDRGEHEGTYYIAMECLTGRTLKEVITQEAPLGQEHAIDLGIQVLTRRRVRAPPRRDPPRLQAAQRHRRRPGPRQGHRLRHRPRGRLGDDGDRLDHGHRAVPLARAGAGPRGHRRVGPLLDRRDALRDARGAAALRRRQRGVDRAEAPQRGAGRPSPRCARTSTRRWSRWSWPRCPRTPPPAGRARRTSPRRWRPRGRTCWPAAPTARTPPPGRPWPRCPPTTAATPASPSPRRRASAAAGRGSPWRL